MLTIIYKIKRDNPLLAMLDIRDYQIPLPPTTTNKLITKITTLKALPPPNLLNKCT